MTTWRTMSARLALPVLFVHRDVSFLELLGELGASAAAQARDRDLPQAVGDGAVGAERAEDADLGRFESR